MLWWCWGTTYLNWPGLRIEAKFQPQHICEIAESTKTVITAFHFPLPLQCCECAVNISIVWTHKHTYTHILVCVCIFVPVSRFRLSIRNIMPGAFTNCARIHSPIKILKNEYLCVFGGKYMDQSSYLWVLFNFWNAHWLSLFHIFSDQLFC